MASPSPPLSPSNPPPSKRGKIVVGHMASLSNSPPSNREKTVLFVVGYTPYKVTLSLPPRTAYSLGEVNEAVGRQLPDPGKGQFTIVASTKVQVGVFQYDKTTGCSKPGNTHYQLLHMPKCRHHTMKMLQIMFRTVTSCCIFID